MNLPVKKLHPDAVLPTKANATDAGFDLYAVEDKRIPAGAVSLVDTGIAMAIPDGHVGLIWDRSSMGVKGIHRVAGVIDSGYRGPVKVALANMQVENGSRMVYHVKKGVKVAQILIQEIPEFELEEVDELPESERGEKGFGSSGS